MENFKLSYASAKRKYRNKVHKTISRRLAKCIIITTSGVVLIGSILGVLAIVESFRYSMAVARYQDMSVQTQNVFMNLVNTIENAEAIYQDTPETYLKDPTLKEDLAKHLVAAHEFKYEKAEPHGNSTEVDSQTSELEIKKTAMLDATAILSNDIELVNQDVLDKIIQELIDVKNNLQVAYDTSDGRVKDEAVRERAKALLNELDQVDTANLKDANFVRELVAKALAVISEIDKSKADLVASRDAAAAFAKRYADYVKPQINVEAVPDNGSIDPVIPGLVFYSQKDARWVNEYVGQWRFGPTGCCPTSVAMVTAKYGSGRSPLDWGRWLYDQGIYNVWGAGTNSDAVIRAAASMGLWHKSIYDLDTLKTLLDAGYPVIALVAPPYTVPNTTHCVVLNGYDGWRTQIMDSLAGRMNGWHSVDDIWQHRSGDPFDYGSTGTAFVAIGSSAYVAPTPPEQPSEQSPDPNNTDESNHEIAS